MKRKAIIIGSPLVKGQKGYLPGVEKDVNNYFKFLTSCEGGQWFPEEIYYWENPSDSDLYSYLSGCKDADICYVIFSGHGFVNSQNRTYLMINKNQNIFYENLYTFAKRQITIIDACRFPIKGIERGNFSGIGDINEGLNYSRNTYFRQFYNNIVSNLPYGKATIFSASIGQYSSDISTLGGWFSYNLIDKAKSLSQNPNLLDTYFSLNEMFDVIQNYMKNNTYKDNPQIPQGITYGNNQIKDLPFVLHYYNVQNYFINKQRRNFFL
ncbi:MAG: caspase family protein [Rickettsiaceae bacterium]|nr:caspase family protein [Rickettsiaceae bacterium]